MKPYKTLIGKTKEHKVQKIENLIGNQQVDSDWERGLDKFNFVSGLEV